MSIEHRIRVLAGTLILTSLALTLWVSPYWMILAAFVGANMLQSAFTKFCLAEIIMRKVFKWQ
ncbi:MAG: DUF2892 domain-containing protein [Candidatus Zixiibacteriota bacterium]